MFLFNYIFDFYVFFRQTIALKRAKGRKRSVKLVIFNKDFLKNTKCFFCCLHDFISPTNLPKHSIK